MMLSMVSWETDILITYKVRHSLCNEYGKSVHAFTRTKHVEVVYQIVYQILRYLKSAPGRILLFSKKKVHEVEGYTDIKLFYVCRRQPCNLEK